MNIQYLHASRFGNGAAVAAAEAAHALAVPERDRIAGVAPAPAASGTVQP